MSADEQNKRDSTSPQSDEDAESNDAEAQASSEADASSQDEADDADGNVDFTRRSLVKAGWTVPVILAVGLPDESASASPGPYKDKKDKYKDPKEPKEPKDNHDDTNIPHDDVPQNSPSSKRWKRNIQQIEDALDKIRRLRGVSYEWRADGRHDIGVIAEEVGDVVPEVVTYEANGVDAKGVDYARLVPLLIEAVKEQQLQIDQLRAVLSATGAGAS